MNSKSYLVCLASLAAFAMSAIAASAQTNHVPKALSEVLIDIDGDGKLDRAVLVQAQEQARIDLYIYLAGGDGALDLARKPDVLKQDIVPHAIVGLQGKGSRSLLVTSGCGGCSNDNETTLTIAYRGGSLVVAGYTLAWDTRNGQGVCDVNYLTGQGFILRGLNGKKMPIKGRFNAVKVVDWSEAKEPAACKKI